MKSRIVLRIKTSTKLADFGNFGIVSLIEKSDFDQKYTSTADDLGHFDPQKR